MKLAQQIADEIKRQGYEIVPLGTEARLAEAEIELAKFRMRKAVSDGKGHNLSDLVKIEELQARLAEAERLLRWSFKWNVENEGFSAETVIASCKQPGMYNPDFAAMIVATDEFLRRTADSAEVKHDGA